MTNTKMKYPRRKAALLRSPRFRLPVIVIPWTPTFVRDITVVLLYNAVPAVGVVVFGWNVGLSFVYLWISTILLYIGIRLERLMVRILYFTSKQVRVELYTTARHFGLMYFLAGIVATPMMLGKLLMSDAASHVLDNGALSVLFLAPIVVATRLAISMLFALHGVHAVIEHTRQQLDSLNMSVASVFFVLPLLLVLVEVLGALSPTIVFSLLLGCVTLGEVYVTWLYHTDPRAVPFIEIATTAR